MVGGWGLPGQHGELLRAISRVPVNHLESLDIALATPHRVSNEVLGLGSYLSNRYQYQVKTTAVYSTVYMYFFVRM